MFKQKSKTPITVKHVLVLVLPVLLVVVAVVSAWDPRQATAATSNTVNFQARLLTAAGNVVPDGYYNVEFKLYRAEAKDGGETPVQGGCTTNPGGVADEDCLWTETRINADKVRVANGYLTVNLGSVTAFPGNMPWDQQLWLTMNIGGTGSPSWDGEMNPRLKLTATPYAFSSGKVVSSDGTGSATVANGDSGTICIQGSANCGFIRTSTATLQTADTNLSIQSTASATTVLNVRGTTTQTGSLLTLQGYNGAILNDLFEVNNEGALTLHGTGTVGFVTPAGSTVKTKIRIPLYDPSTYGQVLMFGLPAGSHATARALTVVDARTGSHQPTITVLSPNENEVFGLSWDGSNNAAKLKTSSVDLILGNSSGDAAVFSGTQIDLNRATNVNGNVDLLGANRAYYISGTAVCTSAGCTAAAASAIQNSTAQQTTANFWIDGTGKAAALQAASLDTVAAAGTLIIGGTNATGGISLAQNTTIAANKSLILTGGTSGNRPASPAEGTVFYDTTTKQLLVYANGKWQADRSSSSKIVGMGTATGCTGSTPVASLNADAADYVVTSCTSAQTTINSAITALGSTGGTVYLMEGTYIIDGTINLAANVHVTGAGPGTILKFKNASSATLSMFTASSVNRLKMSNLRLDGNRANNGSASSQTAITLTTVGSGTGVTAVPGIQITEMTIEGFLWGVLMNTVSNSSVTDSYFGQNTQYAIDTNTAGSRVTIADNKFYNNPVETLGPTYWTVSGNSFDGTSNGAYVLDMLNSGNSFHMITGNTFNGNGMSLSGSQNTISGNSIVTTNQNGINISGGANTISGNKVHDTSGSTFSRIVISGSNNTITGNDLTAGGGTGYAISIANIGAANNTLSNNRFSGTGASVINDSGKDTIYNGQASGSNDIILRGQAGLGLNATTVTASVTLQGGLQVNQLPVPGAPTVTKQGTHTNAAVYTYAISATDGIGGETWMSSTASVTAAQNSLTGSIFNRLSWSRVGGAMSYKVYRTAASGGATGNSASTGLIGTVNASATTMQFDDTGIAANGAFPTGNTTGGAYFAGGVTAANGMNIGYTTGNLFTIQGPSSTFVSVNAQNGKFAIGETGVCSIGRFCVGQVVAGTGNEFTANVFNYLYVPSTITVGGGTTVGEDITIHDASTVNSGTRPANVGIIVDFTNSTNSYSTYNGLSIKNKATTSGASFGGNAIQVDNGSTTTFRASNTGAILVQNTVNSTALFDVKNAAGTSLFKIDSSNGVVSIGDPTVTAASAARITLGDTACGGNGCIWIGESGTTDSDILQMHGADGMAFSVGSSKQAVFVEDNGTFNVSDNWASQTKGYRLRTDGSGLDLQATGAGTDGELWLSGYSTTNYSGPQVNFMRMMAYNRTVQVGDAADTATPTILALAKKTDSGSDPTGYEGGMYYNTQLSKMRCYQGGSWADCMGIPKPNTRRSSYYGATSAGGVVFGAGTSATLSMPAAFAGYGDSVSAMGNGGSSIAYTAPTSAGAPGAARITSAPTASNGAGIWGGNILSANANPSMQVYASPGRTSAYRMFVGMSDASTIVNQTNTDTPDQNYIGFRASSSASNSGFWQCVNDNSSQAPTVTVTSVSVTADGGNRFEIIYDSGTRIIYKINNVVVCTHTAKLPASSVVFRTQVMSYTTSAANLPINISWVYTESNY